MKNKQLPKKDSAYGNFLFAKYELEKHNYEEELNYLVKGHIDYFNSKKNFFEQGTNYWLKDLPKTKELEQLNTKEIDNNAKPIFIVGVPRCGSTVVEKVIASGSKSIPIGEECSIINTVIGDKILKKELLNFNIMEFQNILNSKYKELGLLRKESDYIFTDKTLDNFFFLDIIKKIFPKAKVINCKRNPIASIMSILKNNLGDVAWAHKLEHIFLYFDIYHQKINNFKKKYPDFIYDLTFEDFQNKPEFESKKIMKFCGLPWEKKCLEFHKRKDLISFTASHRQIRKPIYKISKDKNKPYKVMLSKYGSKYNWFN